MTFKCGKNKSYGRVEIRKFFEYLFILLPRRISVLVDDNPDLRYIFTTFYNHLRKPSFNENIGFTLT